MISRETVEALLADFLPRQRWYAGRERPESVTIWRQRTLREGWPALVQLLIDAGGVRYQVPLGLRTPAEGMEFLHSHDQALVGEVPTDGGTAVAYDAVFDPELALVLLAETGAESAERVRLVGAEQSNTSLVYDERVILKIFRRLHEGPNPEVEVTEALGEHGFPWVAAPLNKSSYEEGGVVHHLSVLQPFLAGAVEGWAMALTSLRDLFGVHDTQSIPVIRPDQPPPNSAVDPGQAGGDFSAEASRLGETTAELHIALGEVFGQQPGDAAAVAAAIGAQLQSSGSGFDAGAARRIIARLSEIDDVGPSTRVHGDYHLGQVMRTDAGWYVLDFEGEPARPLEERRQMWSPLRDVAGMLRSFHYAAVVACSERGEVVEDLTSAWEDRNRQAFLDGYLPVASKGAVIPADHDSTMAVLDAFELEKALYELRYERAHRPDWERIPRAGLKRLLAGR